MPAAETHDTTARYSLRWHGSVRGPFAADEVQAMLRKGQVTRFHQVSTDGTSWRQLQDCPDLLPPEMAAGPDAGTAGGRPGATAGLRVMPAFAPKPEPAAQPATEPGLWYLERDGAASGPFSLVDLRAMLAGGAVSWSARGRLGETGEWRPLSDYPELAAGGAGAPGAPEVPGAAPLAGFGRRLAALLLDALAAALAGGCVLVPMALAGRDASGLGARGTVVLAAVLAYVAWLYCALMESSGCQGTLGKLAVGLRVTDLQGRRLTLSRASGRFFARLITVLTLGLGYLPAAFGARRQALHDRLAGTLVVR